MDDLYYSDRELGPRPRTSEKIEAVAWGGIVALMQKLANDGSFGAEFPIQCPDNKRPIGSDVETMALAMQAEIPDLSWPLNSRVAPATLSALDLVEFCYKHVAQPIQQSFHGFFGHYHLDFDQMAGREDFRVSINQIFARNGLVYELKENGQIARSAPPVLRESLQSIAFQTGDTTLDAMLEMARTKYLDPDPMVRRESLEKLWDAWERLKTILPIPDKKAAVAALLDKASDEKGLRETLESEARELTRIGNTFQIRHSETGQTPLQLSEHVDYLFHRLFAMIQLLLASLRRS